jgi:hypothetical protein
MMFLNHFLKVLYISLKFFYHFRVSEMIPFPVAFYQFVNHRSRDMIKMNIGFYEKMKNL